MDHQKGSDGRNPGVLSGLRVVDFTSFMAGPYCARWLADLGAEVVKVEALEGDHMRRLPPLRGGASTYFGHMNSGKKSVAMNLKNPEALAAAKALCMKADVVIEAFRPGVMRRLGLDAQTLRRENSRLVYCSISGFGQNTSISHLPAYAGMVHAASGFAMAEFDYQDGMDKPLNSGVPIADMLTAIFAAFSIQTALLERERTGQGRTIDVTLMDSITNLLVYEVQAAQFPQVNRRPVYKPIRASDGFLLVMPVNESNFRGACTCAGHPEWMEEELFNTDERRWDNWDAFLERLEGWTRRRTADACVEALTSAGVPTSRYRSVSEAMADPQFEERDSFQSVNDAGGPFKTTNLPFAFDGRKPSAGRQVPSTGQDTVAVLTDWLGLEPGKIEAMARARAIG